MELNPFSKGGFWIWSKILFSPKDLDLDSNPTEGGFYPCLSICNFLHVFLVVFCIEYISGIIGGYTDVYLSLSWGISFAAFGYNVFMNLDHMGDDPRCFIGWEDQSKTRFAALTLGFGLLSLIMMLVVLCNIHNSALRRRVFVEELASLSQG